jgi:hypothetical protein
LKRKEGAVNGTGDGTISVPATPKGKKGAGKAATPKTPKTPKSVAGTKRKTPSSKVATGDDDEEDLKDEKKLKFE